MSHIPILTPQNTHSLALSALRHAFTGKGPPPHASPTDQDEEAAAAEWMDADADADAAAADGPVLLLGEMRAVPLYRAALLGVGMAVA